MAHAEDIKAARLAQTDARIAELKDELKGLTEKRKAYETAKPFGRTNKSTKD